MEAQTAVNDEDIPDLVLETIFWFVADGLPVAQWGDPVCAVSKRWCRLARRVFRDKFRTAWPKFAFERHPPSPSASDSWLQFSAHRDRVSLGRTVSNYLFWFVEPVALPSLASLAVQFTVSPLRSPIYIGVCLVHSRSSRLFDSQFVWSPNTSAALPLSADGDFSMAILGMFSRNVTTINCTSGVLMSDIDSSSLRLFSRYQSSSGGDEPNTVSLAVQYSAGGSVLFQIDECVRTAKLNEDAMKAKYSPASIVVAFVVAIGTGCVIVSICRAHPESSH
jgi:hypothetical protein